MDLLIVVLNYRGFLAFVSEQLQCDVIYNNTISLEDNRRTVLMSVCSVVLFPLFTFSLSLAIITHERSVI